PSGHGEEEEFEGEEPSGMMEPSGPPSGEFEEEEEEPSRHRRMDPSMSMPSGEPSGMAPSGPSGHMAPSGPSMPSEPSRRRLDPSVQPHHHTSRYEDEECPAPPGRSKPSRHAAGFPAAMSTSVPKPASSGKIRSA